MEKLVENFFPFHFVIDSRFRITQKGKSCEKLFPEVKILSNFTDHFEIIRPRFPKSFDQMKRQESTLIVVQSKANDGIQVKGQIRELENEQALLFVFTPIIKEVSFYANRGITMDDLPFYDNSLEFLFALQAANKNLEEAKLISRKFEERVAERTQELILKNEEFQIQHEEFLQQQEQLHKQSEFLELKNRKLQRARELIHSKNRELKKYSKTLENQVQERTQDLTNINRELTEQNNQLEQFAFIVAHNLRAPIARILGLLNLMRLQSMITPEIDFYMESIKVATRRLEEVIKDLNIILEIRKGLNEAYQFIVLSGKIDKVKETLRTQIDETGTAIYSYVQDVNHLYSISSYIENILYNLISNAIKYRHPERDPIIKIVAEDNANEITITVSDNGMGFDVSANQDNLFKLYKRFHDHVDGKGLGLYMVKVQVEALGGSVMVDSKLNEGTSFRVTIPRKHSPEEQETPAYS